MSGSVQASDPVPPRLLSYGVDVWDLPDDHQRIHAVPYLRYVSELFQELCILQEFFEEQYKQQELLQKFIVFTEFLLRVRSCCVWLPLGMQGQAGSDKGMRGSAWGCRLLPSMVRRRSELQLISMVLPGGLAAWMVQQYVRPDDEGSVLPCCSADHQRFPRE